MIITAYPATPRTYDWGTYDSWQYDNNIDWDIISQNDTYNSNSIFNRLPVDSFVFNDTTSQYGLLARSISDWSSFSDLINTIFTKNINDVNKTLSDSAIPYVVYTRLFSDTKTYSDTISTANIYTKLFNDTISYSDSYIRDYIKNITEWINIYDNLSRQAIFNRKVYPSSKTYDFGNYDSYQYDYTYEWDILLYNDKVSKYNILIRYITDTEILSDSVIKTVLFQPVVKDTIITSDILTKSMQQFVWRFKYVWNKWWERANWSSGSFTWLF